MRHTGDISSLILRPMAQAGWLVTAAILCSCASGNSTNGESTSSWLGDTASGAFEALQSPLVDLNLKRQEIPKKLQQDSQNPYAMPAKPVCTNIKHELAELDELLGPDMEPAALPWTKGEEGMLDGVNLKNGKNMAQQQAISMVEHQASVIPVRGLVRRLTGAEKHAQEVDRSYEAGRLRRSFLKGLNVASHCPPLGMVLAEKSEDKAKN